MDESKAIIIFLRNPVLGRVKSRLAAKIGNVEALRIYKRLLVILKDLLEDLPVQKFLFYSDYINVEDHWNNQKFIKRLQVQHPDLGQRMANALAAVHPFISQKIIVGSDCPELSKDIIKQAFNELETHDVVIGPAMDGGYYLLGLKNDADLFSGIDWGTDQVLNQTLAKVNDLSLSYKLLPVLNDIDELKDWEAYASALWDKTPSPHQGDNK